MTRLVIFDFDGTLFDTHESIEYTIKLTFQSLLPGHDLVPADAGRVISSGVGLSDTIRALHPRSESFGAEDEERWILECRTLYAKHGLPMIKAYRGAEELVQYLRSLNILVAIISNKGVEAVHKALQHTMLADLVPYDLIVGDKTPGATRKPDPGSFTNVVLPALRSRYDLDNVEPLDVLVVGDTVADLQFAANIGARVCWCRYGYGDVIQCANLKPQYTIDALEELMKVVCN